MQRPQKSNRTLGSSVPNYRTPPGGAASLQCSAAAAGADPELPSRGGQRPLPEGPAAARGVGSQPGREGARAAPPRPGCARGGTPRALPLGEGPSAASAPRPPARRPPQRFLCHQPQLRAGKGPSPPPARSAPLSVRRYLQKESATCGREPAGGPVGAAPGEATRAVQAGQGHPAGGGRRGGRGQRSLEGSGEGEQEGREGESRGTE